MGWKLIQYENSQKKGQTMSSLFMIMKLTQMIVIVKDMGGGGETVDDLRVYQ